MFRTWLCSERDRLPIDGTHELAGGTNVRCSYVVLMCALPKTRGANHHELVAQAASDGLALSSSYFGLNEHVLNRAEPSRAEPWQ